MEESKSILCGVLCSLKKGVIPSVHLPGDSKIQQIPRSSPKKRTFNNRESGEITYSQLPES